MKHVELGTTGIRTSCLGLGTVELGLPYGLSKEPPPADNVCIELLHEAVAGGISYIDTAAAYGRSEELVGYAFGGRADRPTIATKVALRDKQGHPLAAADQRQHIEASVQRSLRLLQTDRLDVLKIHSAADSFLHDELVSAMQDMVDRGMVGAWGASTYGMTAPADALAEAKVRVLQVAYSILDRRLCSQILPLAREQGVGIVLRSVFLQGVLSDRRRHLPDSMAALARAAESAAQLAADSGLNLSDMSLRFVLYGGAGDVTIVGTAHSAELRQNLIACEAGPLSPDLVAALETIDIDDPELLNPGAWPEQPVQSK